MTATARLDGEGVELDSSTSRETVDVANNNNNNNDNDNNNKNNSTVMTAERVVDEYARRPADTEEERRFDAADDAAAAAAADVVDATSAKIDRFIDDPVKPEKDRKSANKLGTFYSRTVLFSQ